MAASRTTLLLALTGSTALAAWQPAWAACITTAADTYSCAGTGETIYLPVGANAAVTVAGGTTASGNDINPLFAYASAGSLNVGQGAVLDGARQSVAKSAVEPWALLQVTNAGELRGSEAVSAGSRLQLTNQSTGIISSTGTAVKWMRYGEVTNNGTIQGDIDGNEGEINNWGTITGTTQMIYTAVSNNGTMNAIRAQGQLHLFNAGTITGDVRKDGDIGYVVVNNSGTLASLLELSGQGDVYNTGTIGGAVTLSGAVNLYNSGTVAGPVAMNFNGYSGTKQTIVNGGTLQSTLYAHGNTTLDNQGTIAGAVTLDSRTARHTVINSGEMKAGLRMSGAGTITNASTGTIANGVNLDGQNLPYTLSNDGTITGGVASQGGLNLTNTATGTISGSTAITFNWLSQIVNNGTIQGAIMGNQGEVTNNGTLTGDIDLVYGAIVNSGIITGAARGWANNIISNASTGTITGEVRVEGNGAWELAITNAGRMESTVRATGSGTLNNSGTIVGAVTTGGAVNLDNSGTIAGAVQMEVNGVGGSVRGQTITNRGTLQSTLYARGDTTLDNQGTIVGAITLDSGATRYTVSNSGQMQGALNIASAATLNNSGTILGPVQMAGTNDTVVVRPGAVFGGTVSAGGGDDTLLLFGPGRGSLDLSRLLDFELMEVHDGDWTLDGSTAMPTFMYRGVMRGTGTFGSITLLNNSTLAPGTSGNGVLTANGNVGLSPSSVLLIEINGASNSMLRATGTVFLRGTLSVNAPNGMRKGQYVLIDAANLTGDFNHILLPGGPWRQTLERNGGQLVLNVDVLSLQPMAGGGSVVSALEGLRSGGGGAELSQIIDAVIMMPGAEQARVVASMTPERQAGTPTMMAQQVNFFHGAIQNRVAQMGGSPRGGGSAPIQLALAGTHLEGLDGTTLHAGQSRWSEAAATGIWIAPWGGVARQKEGGGATGWNASSGGIAIGADTSLGKDLVGGAAAGWGRTGVTYGGVGGDSGNDVLVGSLYGAWTPSPWTVDAGLTVALSRFDTTRKVLAGTETRTARSDYAGRTVAASLGGKRRFDADGLEISPDARLTATRWWLDGYDESGAGALDLHVDGRSGNRLRAETGVELATSVATESGRVRPWLRLAAAHDWTSGSRALQARFAGTAAGFAVDGKDDTGLRWLPGAGLSLDLSKSVEASLEYQAELRHDFQAHTGQVALRYRF